MTASPTLKWHHYERITDNWMLIPAAVLVGWVACSAYYKIPELLHEHDRLETILEHRAQWREEQGRAMAAEQSNSERIDALERKFHDMENRGLVPAHKVKR